MLSICLTLDTVAAIFRLTFPLAIALGFPVNKPVKIPAGFPFWELLVPKWPETPTSLSTGVDPPDFLPCF